MVREGRKMWKGKEDLKLCLRNISVNKYFARICNLMADPGQVLAHTFIVPANSGHQLLGAYSAEGLLC